MQPSALPPQWPLITRTNRATVGRHGVITAEQARQRAALIIARVKTLTLSPEALKVLADLPRAADNPWVIASQRPGKRLSNISTQWHRVRKRAGLEDVRLHDLRHSWASRALTLGESLPVIGRLLGHSQVETTARYAHLAHDSMHEAAALIAASIGADLLSSEAGSGTDRPTPP